MSQLAYKKKILRAARRLVVKIGSQILSSREGVEDGRIRGLVRDLAALHGEGKELVVVSSGAVAAGMTRLGLSQRPKTIPQKQALAAVGGGQPGAPPGNPAGAPSSAGAPQGQGAIGAGSARSV